MPRLPQAKCELLRISLFSSLQTASCSLSAIPTITEAVNRRQRFDRKMARTSVLTPQRSMFRLQLQRYDRVFPVWCLSTWDLTTDRESKLLYDTSSCITRTHAHIHTCASTGNVTACVRSLVFVCKILRFLNPTSLVWAGLWSRFGNGYYLLFIFCGVLLLSFVCKGRSLNHDDRVVYAADYSGRL